MKLLRLIGIYFSCFLILTCTKSSQKELIQPTLVQLEDIHARYIQEI